MPKSKTTKPAKKPAPRRLPSHTIDRAWFDARLEAAGITHRELAQAIGKDRTMVTWTLMGRRRIALAEAAIWAAKLNVTVDEVMERVGAPTLETTTAARATIPVKGWVGEDLAVRWTAAGLRGARSVAAPGGRGANLIALRIQAPGAFDGAIAFVADHRDAPSPEVIGRICLVRIAGEAKDYLRVVKQGYTRGAFVLTNLADKTLEEDARLEVAVPLRSITLV